MAGLAVTSARVLGLETWHLTARGGAGNMGVGLGTQELQGGGAGNTATGTRNS